MNILMQLHYRLGTDTDVYDTYGEILEVSIESYRRHLEGDWHPVVLRGDYSQYPFLVGVNKMYSDMFAALRTHYREGDNVLFSDSDVVCVKPTRIFGEYQDLRLFWHTDPMRHRGFDPYLNGGIVYVPATMDPSLWQIVDERVSGMQEWDDSQVILNKMFYSQHPVPYLVPSLNWSPIVPSDVDWKYVSLVHFNSTRGAEAVLADMKEMTCKSVSSDLES